MSGHGHVFPNANGSKARCGGPGICPDCSREQAQLQGAVQYRAKFPVGDAQEWYPFEPSVESVSLPLIGRAVVDAAARARQEKWDRRHLKLAAEVATWSKDPSTQVGALITTPANRPVSWGFNGFPIGVNDDPARYADRELKYKLIVHGELNALANARGDVTGCTLYTWPFSPCVRCAGVVIQEGIKRVVAPVTPPELVARWAGDLALAEMLFSEAGVELVLLGEPA